MIRFRIDRPPLSAVLAEVEELFGREAAFTDDNTALFNGAPPEISGSDLGKIARRVRSLVELTVCSDGDTVALDDGRVYKLEGRNWVRFLQS